jgi:hypothetical protein
MKLIEDWKSAWKMLSVQANIVGASIIGGYMYLPEEFKKEIPTKYVLIAAGVSFLAGLIGRIIDQNIAAKL